MKSKLRAKMFKAARNQANHTEYSLHGYVGVLHNSCWIGDHIDSLTAQKLATGLFSFFGKLFALNSVTTK
jgi:hypothetical protein